MSAAAAEAEHFRFADMDSAAGPRFGAGARVDPYWDRLWLPGSQAVWSTAFDETGTSELDEDAGAAAAATLFSSVARRGSRIAALGVLDSWRTVTAQQLCAFTGSSEFAARTKPVPRAFFDGGVLDIGGFPRALQRSSTATLYRPSPTTSFNTHLAPRLTYPEWLAITGGTGWSTGHQFDRHNILAAELALRAAEYTSMVPLGEKFASVDLLAHSGLGKPVNLAGNRTGDGVLVRDDGLRVVFEITSSAHHGVEAKVEKWARLIAERPLETSGLVVIFVLVPHPDVTRNRQTPASVASATKKKIGHVLRSFPSRSPDAPANRIGVVSWADWFPAAGTFTEAFLTGTADFPGEDLGQWRTQDLFMDYAFQPWSGFDATAVLDNVNALGATPHWQRTRAAGEIIGRPSTRAGRPRPMTDPSSTRARGEPVAPMFGRTRVPVRLHDPLGVTGARR
ncbi:hypothetical protein GCM10011374_35450 [Kocuria dechangensis]|uniref:Uncharacterized protein n=1 Tax=Kocuria dechangensis TaxID=1176249 RepID=A0A917H5L8_9MICC|nr:hypothetical protein [Kocuria dechangensis]GGG68065.1 hypothetical protein GCM10011374_35450 [Kocuria dechangensis]